MASYANRMSFMTFDFDKFGSDNFPGNQWWSRADITFGERIQILMLHIHLTISIRTVPDGLRIEMLRRCACDDIALEFLAAVNYC